MRASGAAALIAILIFGCARPASLKSALDLSPSQRFDVPKRIAATSLRFKDFIGFVASVYKVPMLVEMVAPPPDVKIADGTYSARAIIDTAVRQMPGYSWRSEQGVAHIYQEALSKAKGNLLNFRVHRFWLPNTVEDFNFSFRNCLWALVMEEGCGQGGVVTGVPPPGLDTEKLPYGEPFHDVLARNILLRALQANGHFYVVIAFESSHPRSQSQFPFLNWFTRSLNTDEAEPMWINNP